MARVTVIKEAKTDYPGDWNLCFQWCLYDIGEGEIQHGYRFIWRYPEGNLQAARGQARIPSIKILESLVQMAKDEGWGDHEGESWKK